MSICRLTLTGGTFLISKRQFGFYFNLFVFASCLAAKFQSSFQLSKGKCRRRRCKNLCLFCFHENFSPSQKDKQIVGSEQPGTNTLAQKFFAWHLSTRPTNKINNNYPTAVTLICSSRKVIKIYAPNFFGFLGATASVPAIRHFITHINAY